MVFIVVDDKIYIFRKSVTSREDEGFHAYAVYVTQVCYFHTRYYNMYKFIHIPTG